MRTAIYVTIIEMQKLNYILHIKVKNNKMLFNTQEIAYHYLTEYI